MARYELTNEQRKRCLEIWNCLKRLGVEAGTPERGKKWWNWPKYANWIGAMYDGENDRIIPRHIPPSEPLTAGGFILKFYEGIMKGLFEHDYPCNLNHAIRYYVLTIGIDEWDMNMEEINKRILYNLYKHPEYV